MFVLILVLVEDGLRVLEKASDWVGDVLILVLVEDGLRGYVNPGNPSR